MSSISYFLVRPAPITTVRSGKSSSTETDFVSLAGTNADAKLGLPVSGNARRAESASAFTSFILFVSSAMTSDSASADPAEAHSMDLL